MIYSKRMSFIQVCLLDICCGKRKHFLYSAFEMRSHFNREKAILLENTNAVCNVVKFWHQICKWNFVKCWVITIIRRTYVLNAFDQNVWLSVCVSLRSSTIYTLCIDNRGLWMRPHVNGRCKQLQRTQEIVPCWPSCHHRERKRVLHRIMAKHGARSADFQDTTFVHN